MKGRQRFQCVGCGLVIDGRENSRGEIMAYDRAPTDDSPIRPCICVACQTADAKEK